MKLTNVKHVFFDLDHTLWDFERNSELAFRKMFQQQALDLDLGEFMKVYKPINQNYWERYRNNTVGKEELRYGRLKDSFDALKFNATDSTINILADLYIEYLPKNNYLLEGSTQVLSVLKKRYTLHIITNGFEEVQHRKMTGSGIADYFKTVTTSEEAGVKKPNPAIFELALHKSEAIPENSIMIGDNLEADIVGAEKMGIKAIYLNPENHYSGNSYLQIKKLKELLNYL